MPDQNMHQIAAELDRLAEQLAGVSNAPVVLRMIAETLRGDEASAQQWLTQFLHQVETGELLSAAALKLELEAAAGNRDARRAAEHVTVAGTIYYGEG